MPSSLPAPWRTLPEKPNLDQLKKQSKELLRSYLAGEPESVAIVASADSSPNPGGFALADAQRVIARSYGFSGWTTLKRHIETGSVRALCDAAIKGDVKRLRAMLKTQPELVKLDLAENDEHRAIHFAVLHRQREAVRLLMEAGSDANNGIYPNRDATTARTLAADRGFDDITAIIDEVEQHRREAASAPGAAVTPLQEQINAAIRSGNIETAIAQLSSNPQLINAADQSGSSPLHAAAAALNEEMTAWLLTQPVDANSLDSAGSTPLERAVYAVQSRNRGSIERFSVVAASLIAKGATVSLPAAIAIADLKYIRDLYRSSPDKFNLGLLPVEPLSIAVRHRQIESARLLIDLGLDPDERVKLNNLESEAHSAGSPLWYAVVGEDPAMAEFLLDRGADPNAMVYASGTPTSQAFGIRNERLQMLLMGRGGKLDPEFVGLYRQTERASRLLDGTEQITVDINGYSGPTLAEQLLWGGACGGDPNIVRLALEQIDWLPGDSRWFNMAVQPLRLWNHGPGHWAGGYDRTTYIDCFRLIVARCDVNALSRQGATLLHRVASDGTTWRQEVMTSEERLEFAQTLIDAGARFDLRDLLLKSTPMGWAARWGRADLVKLYLERSVNPDEVDAEAWARPIEWAKRYHHESILSMLTISQTTE